MGSMVSQRVRHDWETSLHSLSYILTVLMNHRINLNCERSSIMLERVWREENSLALLVGMSIGRVTMESSMVVVCCSVAQSCLALCNHMGSSTPGFPVLHHVPEFTQTHVHQVGDAIQPSHPLSSPSPPAFNLSQHQCHFQWVSSSHQVPRVLELQLQHQSFQWIFRSDFL